ncbi:cell division protein FtsL [Roseomonas haemaphysalidis]|uniref:Cell division protein FtsL n=1 Tax=Roseomonas haemaphysalidis TaxID=2768162 RepID=A0ABS3KTL5_9PROT|nr:hypothetical protein [Roseomonas haemaphysalidis]MBO1080815.1 hypothetical protein [Roseomonas haemaphysalidis]
MFRPLTVIAITAFCVVGWNVYRAEDAARHLDRELRDLQRRTEQARDRTQVLKAEWALLNEPERLRQVAQKYLPLETMTPAQFLRLPELERKLPVAVAFAGPVNLFAPPPGAATAVAAAEPPHPPAAAPPVTAPVAVAAAHAAPPPALVAAARAATPPAASLPTTVAAARPAPRPEPVQAEARPAPVAVARAEEPRRRLPLPVPRAETVALREPAPVAVPAPVREAAPRREATVAEAVRPGLLRQAMHMPISSANAATLPVPGTGGSIGAPSGSPYGGSSLGGSSLGGVARGGLAAPVPMLPAPVPVR